MNLLNNTFGGVTDSKLVKSFFLKQNDLNRFFNTFPSDVTTDAVNWIKFKPGTSTNQSPCSSAIADNDTFENVQVLLKPFYQNKYFCKPELRPTALSLGFRANDEWSADVINALTESKVAEIGEKLYIERWVGNTSTGSTINGIYTQLDASTTNIDVVGTAITSANVIAELNKVVDAIPVRVREQEGLKIIISPAVKNALYQYWASTPMNQLGVLTVTPQADVFAQYMGIDLVVVAALLTKPNTMIAGVFTNDIYGSLGAAFNSENGFTVFKEDPADFTKYIFQFMIRYAVALIKPEEIVFYKG